MAYLDTTGLSTLWNKIKSVFTTKDQSIPYIVGSSSDSAGVWTGSYDGITSYKDGLTIIYVPQKAGISSGTTLNINGLGAKGCYINNSKMTTHFSANVPVLLTYITQSGVGYWKCADYTDGNTYTSAYCTSSGGTAAKSASLSNYVLTPNTYTFISISNANTVKGAITLNINGRGAKSIYINGRVSSASNYTLPAGTYIVYYDGTNYHFRTDGKLPGELLTNLNQNVISGVSDFDFYDDGTNATTVSLQLKSGLDKRDGLYFDTVNLATGETGETFAAGGGISIPAATTSKAGVMSAADKTKLNSLGSNLGVVSDNYMPDLIGDYYDSIDMAATVDLNEGYYVDTYVPFVENYMYLMSAEEYQSRCFIVFIYCDNNYIPINTVNTGTMKASISGTTLTITRTDGSGTFKIRPIQLI